LTLTLIPTTTPCHTAHSDNPLQPTLGAPSTLSGTFTLQLTVGKHAWGIAVEDVSGIKARSYRARFDHVRALQATTTATHIHTRSFARMHHACACVSYNIL
jgi:hypothetical protein